MSSSGDKKQPLALTVTVGLGDMGGDVIDALSAYHAVLPEVLQAAWKLLRVDCDGYERLSQSLKTQRTALLGRSNTARIMDAGYSIPGRSAGTGIQLKNIYIWDASEFGYGIPDCIGAYVQEHVSDLHVGFCFDSSEEPVEIAGIRVPPLFAYYLIEDKLHTGEVIGRGEVVSSIAGAILTSFLPDTEFDLAANKGTVSTIGFSGKYGLIWASRKQLARCFAKRIVEKQLSKDYKEIEKFGPPVEVSSLVNELDPQELGRKLFDSEYAGILPSQRIPARPRWRPPALEVDLNEERLKRELHEYDKPEWPNRIRLLAKSFCMSLAWKWRKMLAKAGKKLHAGYLRGFLTRFRSILSNELYAPALCEYLKVALSTKCEEERTAAGFNQGDLEAKLKQLKSAIENQPDPVNTILRTAIWLIPTVYLTVGILLTIPFDKSEIGPILAVISGLVLVALATRYVYTRVSRSEKKIRDLRNDAIDVLTEQEAGYLSVNAISETEVLVNGIRKLLDRSGVLLDTYRMHLSNYLSRVKEELDKLDREKYAVLSPILQNLKEYDYIVEEFMRVDIERLLEDEILSKTNLLKKVYSREWDLEEFLQKLHEYCWNVLDNPVYVKRIPNISELLRMNAEIEGQERSVEPVLRDMIQYTAPMTSHDRIGSMEFVIGAPADLVREVESVLKQSRQVSDASILDLGKYPLLFCINRAVIESDRRVM